MVHLISLSLHVKALARNGRKFSFIARRQRSVKTGICDRKMIQFMPANHSNTNRVIAILIYSDKSHFQNVFVVLLRRVAKDVTSSLRSWHKRYDFNAENFRRHSQWKCALQTCCFFLTFLLMLNIFAIWGHGLLISVHTVFACRVTIPLHNMDLISYGLVSQTFVSCTDRCKTFYRLSKKPYPVQRSGFSCNSHNALYYR